MAYANRMYQKSDAAFAATCLAAAEKAWTWLEANPNVNAYVDPKFFGTGTYDDASAQDERYWAATELYNTTRSSKYQKYMLSNPLPASGFGWVNMGSYAYASYLTAKQVDKKGEIYKTMKDNFIAEADRYLNTWKNDGYKVAMDYYVWGSNMDLSNRIMTLIIAGKVANTKKYDQAIMDQVHYLLGRNANDTSYVTGYGDKAAKNPHHRQSVVAKQAVPGMLIGGPNQEIMTIDGDPVSQMVDENTAPAKCYADIDGSYATNEICIYWNSPLAYVLGYLY